MKLVLCNSLCLIKRLPVEKVLAVNHDAAVGSVLKCMKDSPVHHCVVLIVILMARNTNLFNGEKGGSHRGCLGHRSSM